MTRKLPWLAAPLAIAVLAVAAPAQAQGQAEPAKAEPAKAEPAKGKGAPARSQASGGAGSVPKRKVLRLDELTVEGRIQKPQAFFILQRSNLNFEGADKKETFLPKIQKSCEKDPF